MMSLTEVHCTTDFGKLHFGTSTKSQYHWFRETRHDSKHALRLLTRC
jgi:hypothetical protein